VPHPAAVREPGGDGGQVPAGQPPRTQPSQRRPQGSSPRHQLHTRQIKLGLLKVVLKYLFDSRTSRAKARLNVSYYIWRIYYSHDLRTNYNAAPGFMYNCRLGFLDPKTHLYSRSETRRPRITINVARTDCCDVIIPFYLGIDLVKLKAAVLRLKEKAANQLASLEGGEEGGALSEIDSQKGNRGHHYGDLDPVFGPPGAGTIIICTEPSLFVRNHHYLYGSRSFHHLAKIVRKTLISTVF
jgi:hypothetical protein